MSGSECADICDHVMENMCYHCPRYNYCQCDHIPGDERNHEQMIVCLKANLSALYVGKKMIFPKTQEEIDTSEFVEGEESEDPDWEECGDLPEQAGFGPGRSP
jgi:hypothetical protein